jgi:hypothetical protein
MYFYRFGLVESLSGKTKSRAVTYMSLSSRANLPPKTHRAKQCNPCIRAMRAKNSSPSRAGVKKNHSFPVMGLSVLDCEESHRTGRPPALGQGDSPPRHIAAIKCGGVTH